MKLKTKIKAGRLASNHNTTVRWFVWRCAYQLAGLFWSAC